MAWPDYKSLFQGQEPPFLSEWEKLRQASMLGLSGLSWAQGSPGAECPVFDMRQLRLRDATLSPNFSESLGAVMQGRLKNLTYLP